MRKCQEEDKLEGGKCEKKSKNSQNEKPSENNENSQDEILEYKKAHKIKIYTLNKNYESMYESEFEI